jgi:hypothetical protein
VVVDHLALIRHLSLVREVVETKKFAVVVPSAGNRYDLPAAVALRTTHTN